MEIRCFDGVPAAAGQIHSSYAVNIADRRHSESRARLIPLRANIPGTGVELQVLVTPPLLVLSPRQRHRIEEKIEALIALLDAADGDPDLYFDGDEFELEEPFEDSDVDEDDDAGADWRPGRARPQGCNSHEEIEIWPGDSERTRT